MLGLFLYASFSIAFASASFFLGLKLAENLNYNNKKDFAFFVSLLFTWCVSLINYSLPLIAATGAYLINNGLSIFEKIEK